MHGFGTKKRQDSDIQGLSICPLRDERKINPQPDAEYGTTIRIFNPATQVWDIFYGCRGKATRLEAKKEDDKIVLTACPMMD